MGPQAVHTKPSPTNVRFRPSYHSVHSKLGELKGLIKSFPDVDDEQLHDLVTCKLRDQGGVKTSRILRKPFTAAGRYMQIVLARDLGLPKGSTISR
jgi:hypothetical protein